MCCVLKTIHHSGIYSKEKEYNYYKCNLNGCKTNVSAKKLHSKYEDVLRSYNIPGELKGILRRMICDMVNENNTEQKKQKRY